MDDARVGAALRAIRIRRSWTQSDVARRAHRSRVLVSFVERGHLGAVALDTLRSLAAVLDVRLELVARWRGGELDRLVNARHSALHESIARFFASLPGWVVVPEVSFSVFGERGVIDILAWHAASRSLLVIELKTAIVDVQALVADMDRKRRLASGIARDHGWDAAIVSCWVIVAGERTNQRRIAAHRTMLRAAFPSDGRAMQGWLRRPVTAIRCLSLWTDGEWRSSAADRRARVAGRGAPVGPRPRTAYGRAPTGH